MSRARRISALLVDDEAGASSRLTGLLEAHGGIRVIGSAGSVAAARELLVGKAPDVVFLDVEMPGGRGLDLLTSIADRTAVVFVTAHESYAVQAFAVGALDYLVKPVDPERLAETIDRLRSHMAVNAARPRFGRGRRPPPSDRRPDAASDDLLTVPLREEGQTARIRMADICWIESLRNFTRVALAGPPRLFVFRRRLADWLDDLPQESFARIGRSEVVRVAAIQRTEWKSRNETLVVFSDGVPPLVLGRMAAIRLRERLGAQ